MSENSIVRNIEKLGHNLVEVRQRALLHLNTKLDHEIVTIKELNESPGFARKLLEWFNFQSPTWALKYVFDVFNFSLKSIFLG